MCIVGGQLTALNILFSFVLSVAAGLIVSGLWEKAHQKSSKDWLKVGSASTFGLVMGTLTSFCAVCTLPVIGLLGVGSLLTFISQYQMVFQIFSLIFFGLGLYLLNSQLRDRCNFLCKLKK
jgi:hypothetical protein